MHVSFSFTSPDLEISGFLCLKDFGGCQRYCEIPQFCRAYCNPLCCTSKVLRELRCTGHVPESAYRVDSTEFKILPQPWKAADGESSGVYAEDLIVFKGGASNAEMELGKTRFALNLVTSLNGRTGNVESTFNNKVGLRRRSFNESFVNDLFMAGIIPEPMLSIGYSLHRANRQIIFGEHVKEHCGTYNKLDLTNRLEFMFDGVQVEFMSYKAKQNFRIGITETDIFYAPDYVLTHLLNSQVISPKPDSGFVYNITTKITQNFTWILSDGFQIDLEDYNVLRNSSTSSTINIRTISSNPDNMQWILSSAVFYEYCMYIDYGRNLMGFANCLTCGNNKRYG
ncbi:unnamed protein product [Bursaphelenchus xylophilus]|uniref:(pine wood nematode) hypothetical protein n=1 Tax=Bursaphelenchus xylophilus TaxID=6326 RepID=A0A1I7SAL8_BURXY|nr:unnamed protein product [Bursaphelenchus xylophilus]CAG9079212.1 unnamed protein product [Bursaphelenchus xylophilus]